jgi:hypothetical protein
LVAFLETIFRYLCQCPRHFCSDCLSDPQLSFKNTFKTRKRKEVRGIWRMLQRLARYFLAPSRPMYRCAVVQKRPDVSCPCFRRVPCQCIPEATEDFELHFSVHDRLCGLVVTVPSCYPRGHGFDSRRYQIF